MTRDRNPDQFRSAQSRAQARGDGLGGAGVRRAISKQGRDALTRMQDLGASAVRSYAGEPDQAADRGRTSSGRDRGDRSRDRSDRSRDRGDRSRTPARQARQVGD
jgi:hypothetical protein